MDDKRQDTASLNSILDMTSHIVSAYVSNNPVPTANIPDLIKSVYTTLARIERPREAEGTEALQPAVPIRRSITPDYIVCLEDGKKLKMLKRHLRTAYNMSPKEYRAKWRLPPDYPMVAPNYAARRSEFAKKIGLGLKNQIKL